MAAPYPAARVDDEARGNGAGACSEFKTPSDVPDPPDTRPHRDRPAQFGRCQERSVQAGAVDQRWASAQKIASLRRCPPTHLHRAGSAEGGGVEGGFKAKAGHNAPAVLGKGLDTRRGRNSRVDQHN